MAISLKSCISDPVLVKPKCVFKNVLLISYSVFSCDRVDWVEERRFWTFEGLLTLLGLASGLAVFIRQKQLDHRMYQRIQRQIASA